MAVVGYQYGEIEDHSTEDTVEENGDYAAAADHSFVDDSTVDQVPFPIYFCAFSMTLLSTLCFVVWCKERQ